MFNGEVNGPGNVPLGRLVRDATPRGSPVHHVLKLDNFHGSPPPGRHPPTHPSSCFRGDINDTKRCPILANNTVKSL